MGKKGMIKFPVRFLSENDAKSMFGTGINGIRWPGAPGGGVIRRSDGGQTAWSHSEVSSRRGLALSKIVYIIMT